MLHVSIHQLPDLLDPFQSSPTPKGGRYCVANPIMTLCSSFQSSPTPKGGRYHGSPRRRARVRHVSILAHPERWALLIWNGLRDNAKLFQSSPTPKGGRYSPANSWYTGTKRVSILAHPERWALLGRRRGGGGMSDVSILAHPERWALRLTASSAGCVISRFNPRPPPKGGRY